MTFAHCPYKTIFECDCASCAYKPDLILKRENKKYVVRRVRAHSCRFELYLFYSFLTPVKIFFMTCQTKSGVLILLQAKANIFL